MAVSLAEILEQLGNGRVLVHDPVAHTTEVIATGLAFANGTRCIWPACVRQDVVGCRHCSKMIGHPSVCLRISRTGGHAPTLQTKAT